jgi:hypothetical protein
MNNFGYSCCDNTIYTNKNFSCKNFKIKGKMSSAGKKRKQK